MSETNAGIVDEESGGGAPVGPDVYVTDFVDTNGTLLSAHQPLLGVPLVSDLGTGEIQDNEAKGLTYSGIYNSNTFDAQTPDEYVIGLVPIGKFWPLYVLNSNGADTFYMGAISGITGTITAWRVDNSVLSSRGTSPAAGAGPWVFEASSYNGKITFELTGAGGTVQRTFTDAIPLAGTNHGILFLSTVTTGRFTSVDFSSSDGTEL